MLKLQKIFTCTPRTLPLDRKVPCDPNSTPELVFWYYCSNPRVLILKQTAVQIDDMKLKELTLDCTSGTLNPCIFLCFFSATFFLC